MITCWSWWWEAENDQDKLIARTVLTISALALVFLCYKWVSFYTKKATTSLPPGPYGLPVVGYLPFLGTNLHEIFTNMAHRYGPIFSLQLGRKLHVVVNSIDLVKVVARDLDNSFANRSPPITGLTITYGGASILWSNNNTYWRNLRKLLVSQVLSNANLKASQSFRTNEVKKTVHDVYKKIGEKMDINEIVFNTEVNVVTSMIWGRSKSEGGLEASHIGDRFREVEMKIVKLLGTSNISDFFPVLSRFDLQRRNQEMQRHLEYVDRIFDNIIEKRIKDNSCKMDEEDERKDLLQILLELKDKKDTETSFNMLQIKALLTDVIGAATDTTSTMVEWVMAEILNNSDVMQKVQDELTKVVGMNNIVEESHMNNLTYLDAVIKETFRLHPPLPLLINRCPDKSCMVGGYTIPKNTIVYMNVWAIHRDPSNWMNPLEFKPERFLNGKWDYNGNNMKFLPFGSGRRICPGIALGDKMLMYILAALLHSFEWKLPKDDEFELCGEFGLVMKKRKPLVAIPTQRLPNVSLYN
ncbi:hypothetical protein R6Q59_021913 [Mikania micrantha]